MSFQEKNITVSLVNFSLILVYLLIRVLQMALGDSFTSSNVFRMWVIAIILAVVFTVFATVLTHIVSVVIEVIRTGDREQKNYGVADERDRLIDWRGTRITYSVYSLGVFLAMLTFVLGRPPLVMFTGLIFAGIVGQIVGDVTRLVLYRRGF